MSYNAYQQVQQRTENPRDTEYRLFAQVTNALIEAKDLPPTHQKKIKSIDWNRRMWSTFSADCGATGNQLPKELRASIISLAIWVSKHSSKVMRGEAETEALIRINKTVMEGLKAQVALTPGASPSSHAAAAAPRTEPPQTSGHPLNTQLTI